MHRCGSHFDYGLLILLHTWNIFSVTQIPFSLFLLLSSWVVQSIQTRRSYEMIKATRSKLILPQCYCPGSTLKGRPNSSEAAHGPQLHPSDSKPEKTFICGFKSVEGYVTSEYSILIFEHSLLSLPHLKGVKKHWNIMRGWWHLNVS